MRMRPPRSAKHSRSPRRSGEGRGEFVSTVQPSGIGDACARARFHSRQALGSMRRQLWLGEPVELSLQNSSGRFGWLRLVPPHPLALSLREREHRSPRCDESGRSGSAKARRTIRPLPKGEGRGEGESRVPIDQIHVQCFDATPDLFQEERECTTEVWCILLTR